MFALRLQVGIELSAFDSADADKTTVLDSDIRRDSRIARAVKHATIADYDVINNFTRLRRYRHTQKAQHNQADKYADKSATEIGHNFLGSE